MFLHQSKICSSMACTSSSLTSSLSTSLTREDLPLITFETIISTKKKNINNRGVLTFVKQLKVVLFVLLYKVVVSFESVNENPVK